MDCRYKRHHKAPTGGHGMGRDRTGAAGRDIVIPVPVGTEVRDADTNMLLADLVHDGERIMAAEGGAGGLGNAHFKSSTNRAPRRTTPGRDGEERRIRLQLKLLADVGLVGLPNAGKSTYLSAMTRAKPKIADYPFTTLHPHLGIAGAGGRDIVLADIPGLIEGAHEGTGLGDRFLKHIERCAVLIHIVDGVQDDPLAGYRTIRHELAEYAGDLEKRPEILALNKADILDADGRKALQARFAEAGLSPIYFISAATGEGCREVLLAAKQVLDALDESRAEEDRKTAHWSPLESEET